MTEEQLKEKVEELAEAQPKVEPPKKGKSSDAYSEAYEDFIKLKTINDQRERELLRAEELRAKIAMGGKTYAGKEEKTPEEEAKETATKVLSMFE